MSPVVGRDGHHSAATSPMGSCIWSLKGALALPFLLSHTLILPHTLDTCVPGRIYFSIFIVLPFALSLPFVLHFFFPLQGESCLLWVGLWALSRPPLPAQLVTAAQPSSHLYMSWADQPILSGDRTRACSRGIYGGKFTYCRISVRGEQLSVGWHRWLSLQAQLRGEAPHVPPAVPFSVELIPG